jgi:crotonobetainyl-CoA:carnitine CoA-transferase CaiB-like acyl-CoA transferase
VRILAVEQYGAGPFASMYLADMGAEVIKIENPPRGKVPGGDSSRQSGPHFLGDNDSEFFQTFNLSKRSISLDLHTPEGRAIFHKLVGTADAVLNNLRGDQPAKLGLTHDALSGIVCAHLSGYGRFGPRSTWPAYDYLLQAEAGFMDVTGEPGTPPTRMGLSIVDYLSGITTAFALTAALFGAARTGRGRDVDVSLYDVAIHQLTYPAVWYMNEGDAISRRPRSGHPFAVPCETFPTADGHIFIMCILPKFWQALCAIVGHDEWLSDQRFATPAARRQNRDILATLLDEIFRDRTTGEWMAMLAGRIPAAPVLTMPAALDNPYLHDSGGVQTVAHREKPEGLRVLTSPIRLSGERIATKRAPALGEDTDDILGQIGVSPEEIAELRARGIV